MTDVTIATETTPPPAPTEPPTEVRLRATIPGGDYRLLQHVAIETGSSVADLMTEAVRMLLRWYRAQGQPTGPLP